MTTVVYTDGACSGNPGPGGWAWAIPGGRYAAGPAEHTTNQRMEIQAVLEALKTIEGPVEVISDSTYVINCFRDRWWEGWLKRDWKNTAKKPVANRDLWEPLIEIVRARNITFTWVKGHSGDAGNDLVDSLAVEAGKTQKPVVGEGAPQLQASATTGAAGRPAGHLLLVMGHKPPEIGGYGDNATAQGVKQKLKDILAAKAQMFPDLKVVTGMALGAEQLGAEAAIEAKVPFVAVLGFPGQEAVWPATSKDHYRALVGQADEEILLQTKVPDSKQAVGGALNRRNAWLARMVDEAVVVWNGQDPQLQRLVRSLEDHLGESEVWILNP